MTNLVIKPGTDNGTSRDSINIAPSSRVVRNLQVAVTVLLLLPFIWSADTLIRSSDGETSERIRQLALKRFGNGLWVSIYEPVDIWKGPFHKKQE
jgi:hypothetical protein